MATSSIYILGGAQSDFARNWARDGLSLFDGFAETLTAGLENTKLDPAEIEVGHVGNFVGELFAGQAQLGGFFGEVDPALHYLPASRHEAACASGSMALLAAMADLRAGNYQLAAVVGIEQMRNVPGNEAAANLAPAAWNGREWTDAEYLWPCAFAELIDIYRARHGLDKAHLAAISQKNFANARVNPNAQSRRWQFADNSFAEDDSANPTVSGDIRRHDCGQITDGAAVVFIATEERAQEYARARGLRLEDIPRIKGWGHINAPMLFSHKLKLQNPQGVLFPHVQQLFAQTLARAGMHSVRDVDGLEVHDCFNITEYMILDHCGLVPPGQLHRLIEEETFARNGALPVNASGGLIGLGHPVGATGVRMALDGYRQVTGSAGENQIANAKNLMTFNLGGSTTTCASLIIGR
ncbi:thiolase domain-containing protein [Microbulbifer agarilyticus]|uniref:acetyl-CoA acetyltransferase n=1 Tax=Microbulbifer agarilyticus TaxID=260552 RepID=UPI001C98AFF5|nr:acetyl-CoA acetyltransferase [Microbulbifer agarilyticus]MBY6190936.1 thiolase domain-containing protein [Microbulbifer agarilyticus]